ncbi:MAG: 1-acyl-sn-glycerol-3-phosphate acyltransferase [Phycisphaeraceae bacterium]|nr:1-acyl-sn-glycerol-3-phosphate acyltransferase [Phycisphaerales bacterium]QOJ17377.1 MAG: 1-acyl-sn-glycerol-3-phosphate acyltransferase [Phycisphaeraceae bacterium]
MSLTGWIITLIAVVAGGVGAAAWLRPWLTVGPRGSVTLGAAWRFARFFCRVVHQVRVTGLEHLPPGGNRPGPLIVVSNHTCGLDPLLIAAACPFHIRWMMASNYMTPEARWFWRWVDVIPVSRDGKDTGPAREAIRHVREDRGCVGIFPEGGIPDPPGRIRPFQPGVGLIVSRSRAPVLLTWVSGTPRGTSPFGAVIKPSRSRVHFVGLFDFTGERDPQAIADRLRAELARASGWPLDDQPVPTARKRARDPFGV